MVCKEEIREVNKRVRARNFRQRFSRRERIAYSVNGNNENINLVYKCRGLPSYEIVTNKELLDYIREVYRRNSTINDPRLWRELEKRSLDKEVSKDYRPPRHLIYNKITPGRRKIRGLRY